MFWNNLLAAAFTVYGVWRGYTAVKAQRGENEGDSTAHLVSWKEEGESSLRYAPVSTIALTISNMSVIGLAVITLAWGWNHAIDGWGGYDIENIQTLLIIIVIIGSLFIVFNNAGIVMGFYLGRAIIHPVPLHMDENGVSYGKLSIPWEGLDHYRATADETRLLLYSRFSPDLPILIVSPPSVELFSRARALLAEHVPEGRSERQIPWQRRKGTFFLMLCMMSLSALLAGIKLAYLPEIWVLWVLSVISVLMVAGTSRLARLFTFGNFKQSMDDSQGR